jgi:hypothetical protein
MLTKKHYKEIVKILAKSKVNQINDNKNNNVINNLLVDLCNYFKTDNQNFNKDLFISEFWNLTEKKNNN